MALGLRPLRDYCAERAGSAAARLRGYTFAEVEALITGGAVVLMLDGMVLDGKECLWVFCVVAAVVAVQ